MTLSEIEKNLDLKVQSIFVSEKVIPTIEEATQILDSKGFETSENRKVDGGFIFDQYPRNHFVEESLKPFELSDGITSTVGAFLQSGEIKDGDLDGEPDVVNDEGVIDGDGDSSGDDLSLSESQTQELSRLKEEYIDLLSDLKTRVSNILPLAVEFVEFLSNSVENEGLNQFNNEMQSDMEFLSSELDKLENVSIDVSKKNSVLKFENAVRELVNPINWSTTVFEKSESFSNFGKLLRKNADNVEQLILNFPMVKGLGLDVDKLSNYIDDKIDIEKMSFSEFDNYSVDDLENVTIVNKSNMDKQRCQMLLNKYFDDTVIKRVCIIDKEKYTEPNMVSISKNTGETDLKIDDLNKGLPLPDESLEEMVFYKSVHMVVDNHKRIFFMNDIHRVLKKGGVVRFIKTPTTDGHGAFLPGVTSYWNETIFKFFDNLFDVSDVELVDSLITLKMVKK